MLNYFDKGHMQPTAFFGLAKAGSNRSNWVLRVPHDAPIGLNRSELFQMGMNNSKFAQIGANWSKLVPVCPDCFKCDPMC